MNPDKQKHFPPKLISEIEEHKHLLKKIKEVVNHQSNLKGLLSFAPTTLKEFLLISALRHLHAVIEDDVVVAKIYKNSYWDLEK